MNNPDQLKWISDSEFVIGNKVYHSINKPWIENLFKIITGYEIPKIEMPVDKDILKKYDWAKTLDKIKNDNDTTKDKEASESP